jgi:hypothetical protein
MSTNLTDNWFNESPLIIWAKDYPEIVGVIPRMLLNPYIHMLSVKSL